MKLTSILVGILPLAALTSAVPGSKPNKVEDDASKRVEKLVEAYQKFTNNKIKNRTTGCTPSTILRRQEWGSMPAPDRLAYISAVYCLASLNGTTPSTAVPGARTLYDDFAALHTLQTLIVHSNGLFLPFHRYLLHHYEQTLRTRCGYTGAQPYWDWTLYPSDPRLSPVFDGSPTSLGSNGVFVPNRSPIVIQAPGGPEIVHQPATGGGCVMSGPFSPETGWQLHFGPVGFAPQGPDGGLGYNPRCMTRDLSLTYAADCTPSKVLALVDGCGDDLACFLEALDAPGGVHASGHFMVGGVQHDVFTSPADPVFWLHHAMVDRLWAVWQAQKPGLREEAVSGTVTSGNYPPSENATLDTSMTFGVIGPDRTVRDAASTVDGEFCYMYE